MYAKVNDFPDLVMKDDGHYMSFSEVFGSATSEEYRLSLQKRAQKEKTLPFYSSVQHVKNCGLVLMCDECAMWHLVYSKRKLNTKERQELDSALSGLLVVHLYKMPHSPKRLLTSSMSSHYGAMIEW